MEECGFDLPIQKYPADMLQTVSKVPASRALQLHKNPGKNGKALNVRKRKSAEKVWRRKAIEVGYYLTGGIL